MRRFLIGVVAVFLSLGVMGFTHADAYVCGSGSVGSIAEQNTAGALGAQSEMFYGLLNSIDGLVLSRVNHTDVIC